MSDDKLDQDRQTLALAETLRSNMLEMDELQEELDQETLMPDKRDQLERRMEWLKRETPEIVTRIEEAALSNSD